MKRVFMGIIRYYQSTFSPDHGPMKALYPNGYCPYQPTCSEYGYQAFDRHGVIKGIFLTAWRIIRCNPWTKGGPDPVPGTNEKSS